MTVEILRGDIAALPDASLLPSLLAQPEETLTLACSNADGKAVHRLLRTVMDHGYEHDRPARVVLVCADEAVYRSVQFQWNLWFAERKPEHPL